MKQQKRMKQFATLLIIGLFTTLFSCDQSSSKNTNPKNSTTQSITKTVENISATKEQLERRAKSEAYCKAKNIPVYKNPNSLFVDTDEDVSIRTHDEVVNRALALCYLGLKSEGLEQVHLDKMDKDFGISKKLTPNEKAYSTAKQPTNQQKIDANWRYESLHVLLWALGYIDSLSYPNKMCNVADDVKFIYELKEQGFRQKAKLRSKKEILDQADLILRLNCKNFWVIRWSCKKVGFCTKIYRTNASPKLQFSFILSNSSLETLNAVPCLTPFGNETLSEISVQLIKSLEATAPYFFSVYLSK